MSSPTTEADEVAGSPEPKKEEAPAGPVCWTPGCKKAASMKCPTCIKLGMPHTYFCDQDCFKRAWKLHNRQHKVKREEIKRLKAIQAYKVPDFNYTGPLRPHYVSPMREVPAHIQRPDYWATGAPEGEMQIRGDRKIPIYTPEQIKGIRRACTLGREVLDIAGAMVRPGVTCEEIDIAVHKASVARDCYPSPLNYHQFPKSCCTSVNEVICHGIPDERKLEEGDIVNVDITVYHKGYHGDLNETFCVGKVDDESKRLVKTTYEATMTAIRHARVGVMCRDFGNIISGVVEPSGYQVTRTYCGHGIGELFHCQPNIPHYKRNKAVGVLKPGMVFTIEPMVNKGGWRDVTWPDDWTAVTKDGERSSQFEHTILITEDGPEILTARTEHSVPFWWGDDVDNRLYSGPLTQPGNNIIAGDRLPDTSTEDDGDQKEDAKSPDVTPTAKDAPAQPAKKKRKRKKKRR